MAPSRVLLRAPSPSDRDAFLAWARAGSDLHRPWSFLPSTHTEWRWWLERTRGRDHHNRLVWDRASSELVGQVSLSIVRPGPARTAYLGYDGGAGHTRKGLMTEAVLAMLDEGFGALGLHRVEANIQPGNEPSRALARRCGFRLEGLSPEYLEIGGEWRDHERWAILGREHRPAP